MRHACHWCALLQFASGMLHGGLLQNGVRGAEDLGTWSTMLSAGRLASGVPGCRSCITRHLAPFAGFACNHSMQFLSRDTYVSGRSLNTACRAADPASLSIWRPWQGVPACAHTRSSACSVISKVCQLMHVASTACQAAGAASNGTWRPRQGWFTVHRTAQNGSQFCQHELCRVACADGTSVGRE